MYIYIYIYIHTYMYIHITICTFSHTDTHTLQSIMGIRLHGARHRVPQLFHSATQNPRPMQHQDPCRLGLPLEFRANS